MSDVQRTTVGRLRRDMGVRCDRATQYGNPFRIGPDGTREECIAKYRHYLANNAELAEKCHRELTGKRLLCWCSPLPCHCDVIAELCDYRGTVAEWCDMKRKVCP